MAKPEYWGLDGNNINFLFVGYILDMKEDGKTQMQSRGVTNVLSERLF